MKLYLCPGYKTSRNWSKPIKWCAFLFNVKIVYTARWRLFATPDTPQAWAVWQWPQSDNKPILYQSMYGKLGTDTSRFILASLGTDSRYK